MDDSTSEPLAQVAAAPNVAAGPDDDVNGAANGDTTAEGDAAPKKRRRKTRRKRKKKTKIDVNPQDVSYGPSFKPELIFQKFIFAIAVTTYFFNHSWNDKKKPVRIVFLSPLALLFCKYCGVIFRGPETMAKHFNEPTFPLTGRTHNHDYCTRKYPGCVRTLNKTLGQEPTMELHNISDDQKWVIHDIAGRPVIQYHRARTVQPPLGLRHYLRPEAGKKLAKDPKERVWETRRGTIEMSDRNFKDFDRRFPNQKKNPNALWETDTVNYLGEAPFMLTTSSIRVTRLEEWIERKFGRDMNSVWLVACDECTAFGCMGCGAITSNGQKINDCMSNCFDFQAGENAGHSKTQYNFDDKGYKTHKLVCQFAKEMDITELLTYVENTGKENAGQPAPQRGRKSTFGPEPEKGKDTINHHYIDFEPPRAEPVEAPAIAQPPTAGPIPAMAATEAIPAPAEASIPGASIPEASEATAAVTNATPTE